MATRHRLVLVTGSVVIAALVGISCAAEQDTGEVSAESGRYGASLETSTTIADGSRLPGSSRAGGASSGSAAGDLVQQLQDNPELLGQLAGMTPEQLSELTGLSVEELDGLGITPASVAALGTLLVDSQDGSGKKVLDPSVAGLLSGATGALTGATGVLTGETVDTLRRIEPGALAAILGTAATVDPELTGLLGTLLAVVDPNGLGQFAGNQSALAIIAVVASAALGRDVSLANLLNADDADPAFRAVLGGLVALAGRLTPTAVARINSIRDILGPRVIGALGAALGALGDPRIGGVVAQAFEDPFVVGSIFGSAYLLIPGLAETLDPSTYPNELARVAGLGALFLAAIVRMDNPQVRNFLDVLGIDIPPGVLGKSFG